MQATIVNILTRPSQRLAVCALLLACGLPPAAQAQGVLPEPPLFPPSRTWEGAIGLQVNYAPEYQGSDRRSFGVKPGLYLRWGRFYLATAGNFVTRHDDEVARGVGAELVQRDNLRVRLGLRFDPGRKTSDSADLAQLDDVPSTVRARLSTVWQPVPDWRISAGWSNDILGRKGGALVDFGVAREFRVSPRSVFSIGTGVSWGDERYMQARFGISPQAAARSGRLAFEPGGGWRDVALSAQWRTDIDRRWSVWTSAGISHLLGPAADSPLTLQTTQAGVGAGFAWRF